ncbi:MAG: replication-associated recombination protein A [Thermodesulfobacteriota bacterium]|nr:replication-associated recombination protein A [Thermodesulfobacteriota bacterium]
MTNLFDYREQESPSGMRPLADRMRPEKLEDLAGQPHVTGPDSLLRSALEKGTLFSMILWGPPGCGKTTLARILAGMTGADYVQISAVLSGVKEIREVVEAARRRRGEFQKDTILFVDEVHRFSKSQQDAFLPHVESGLVTLIGATTENPSFEVIPALMSRCRLIVLNPVPEEAVRQVLVRALADTEKGLGTMGLDIEPEALAHLAALADGDVRTALNNLEAAALLRPAGPGAAITLADVEQALDKKALLYDKSGEEHYNLISALHKSLRGSDPDAAVYWLERMLSGGEDPFYILRRMVRFASEDIGNADPSALGVTINAMESYRFLGSPEGDLAIVQAAVYLATAPKSNSLYTMHGEVKGVVKQTGYLPVPKHIRNAPTNLMKGLGYGKDYKYAHDFKEAYVPQDYLPEKLAGRFFYHPTQRGYEKTVKERLDKWRALKKRYRENEKKGAPDDRDQTPE